MPSTVAHAGSQRFQHKGWLIEANTGPISSERQISLQTVCYHMCCSRAFSLLIKRANRRGCGDRCTAGAAWRGSHARAALWGQLLAADTLIWPGDRVQRCRRTCSMGGRRPAARAGPFALLGSGAKARTQEAG